MAQILCWLNPNHKYVNAAPNKRASRLPHGHTTKQSSSTITILQNVLVSIPSCKIINKKEWHWPPNIFYASLPSLFSHTLLTEESAALGLPDFPVENLAACLQIMSQGCPLHLNYRTLLSVGFLPVLSIRIYWIRIRIRNRSDPTFQGNPEPDTDPNISGESGTRYGSGFKVLMTTNWEK